MSDNQTEVNIIPRTEIPAITEIEQNGQIKTLGELRDFRWHNTLNEFLPSDEIVSFSWVKLGPNETLEPHSHSTASMIICYKGAGEFLGNMNKPLQAGDVVTVPKDCLHGFKGKTPDGLWALSIQFGKGLYTDPKNPRVTFADENTSFESLLAFNQHSIARFKQCRFLKMLTDGTLDDDKKRQCYVDALQIWSNSNQDLLFARQATTDEKTYTPEFLQHFFEEVGHDQLHAQRNEKSGETILTEDPVIEAVANWFICQMFRKDNAEKAALVHLVIENASDIYHRMARPTLSKTVNDEYFELHEADTEHAKIGLRLLNHLSPAQYQSIHQIVKKGWEMLDVMTNRVCELVDNVVK